METSNFIAHENRPYFMVQEDLRMQTFLVEKRLPETDEETGWVKMQYYTYMKSVTDAWIKMLNYEGGDGVLASGDHVAVSTYRNREYLMEYDTHLKYIHDQKDCESSNFYDWRTRKQKTVDKFLQENTFSYEDWFEKIYKTKIAR